MSKRAIKRVKSVSEFFQEMEKRNISPEDIASKCRLSANAVRAWKHRKHFPKFPTRKYLESIYGIEIAA